MDAIPFFVLHSGPGNDSDLPLSSVKMETVVSLRKACVLRR